MRRNAFAFLLASLVLAAAPASAQQQLIVGVANEFGFPVADLKAPDFVVKLDKDVRAVQSAEYQKVELVDAVLLLDTSEAGKQVRGEIAGAASLFIDRLKEQEQMAIIGFATSADLLQDFTASPDLLRRALSRLRFGNAPSMLDSIYAAVDGAFANAAGRRVLMVVATGFDFRNRVRREEVIEQARRRDVSVFAISLISDSDLQKITEQTAGHYYRGRQLKQIQQVVENLTAAFRGHYVLSVAGGPLDYKKLKLEVPSRDKLKVSYRIAR